MSSYKKRNGTERTTEEEEHVEELKNEEREWGVGAYPSLGHTCGIYSLELN